MFRPFVLQLEASFIALGQLVVCNQSLVDNALALNTHAPVSLLCTKLQCVCEFWQGQQQHIVYLLTSKLNPVLFF